MNRLQYENSPYLLQHKNNPVDWYPWCEEAISKSKSEDKPILLSIGYSACHWCHVMEHESFENESIASIMNQHFINIKVDREERPDIDQIYMNYVQMTTGHGGWPLTVFLTPNLIPFFGGTYFPPVDKFGRPGFSRILKIVSETYYSKKNEIFDTEEKIKKSLSGMSSSLKGYGVFEEADFEAAFRNIIKIYDEEWGGFGSAPKFPGSMTHQFLLHYYYKTGSNKALEIVEHSLKKMAQGGIYDQIGGGFHRYSTDNEWLVPHFEKMLYDNALLSRLYLETYQLTKKNYYLNIGEDILQYVMKEMTDNSGGFYSAQDADSEGVEGKFFLWNSEELKNFLTEEQISLAKEFYAITDAGNFEGENILTSKIEIEELAIKRNKTIDEIDEEISEIRKQMCEYREKRIKPGTDDKILTSWNALMLYSFALVYGITMKKEYRTIAIKNGEFIWEKCFIDNTLYHSYKKGELKFNGYLDNYTYTAEAFIKLYEITFDEKWLNRADELIKIILERFYDSEKKDFYFTENKSDELIVRMKDLNDGALPSGNSVAYYVLQKLGIYFNNITYKEIASEGLKNMQQIVVKYPTSFSYFLMAALYNTTSIDELAVVCVNKNEFDNLINTVHSNFYPFLISAAKVKNEISGLELLRERDIINNKNTFYVCKNYTCNIPVNNFELAEKQLIKYSYNK